MFWWVMRQNALPPWLRVIKSTVWLSDVWIKISVNSGPHILESCSWVSSIHPTYIHPTRASARLWLCVEFADRIADQVRYDGRAPWIRTLANWQRLICSTKAPIGRCGHFLGSKFKFTQIFECIGSAIRRFMRNPSFASISLHRKSKNLKSRNHETIMCFVFFIVLNPRLQYSKGVIYLPF